MTLSEFINLAGSMFPKNIEVRYIHPSLFLLITDNSFESLDDDLRMSNFLSCLSIRAEEVEQVLGNSLLEIRLLTSEERNEHYSYIDESDSGKHWLGAFDPIGGKTSVRLSREPSSCVGLPRALHFYGYKGGQGRSTVMLAFSKMLADSNYRVLIVDADIEAPSLDSMLSVSAGDSRSTLMGICGRASTITPLTRAYIGKSNLGQVDLLPCRPNSSSYDMDFAAFLLNASLDPMMLENGIRRLREFASQVPPDGSRPYDIVLFDHRTGLAPSILPIMQAWPGAAVVFIRPDGMARHVVDSKLIDLLLGHDPEAPGAFVSFSLKSKQMQHEARATHARFIETLLEKISDVITDSTDVVQEDIDPAELERYWVYWKHDDSLADGNHPLPSDLSKENRDALSQLRSILGVDGEKLVELSQELKLTSSGSTDEGQFILTPDIAKIFSIDSPYTYIFGRKGTGKTRLLSELRRQSLGEALLVAADSTEGGLQSSGPLFNLVLEYCGRDFELFWWFLLDVAMRSSSTNGPDFEKKLREEVSRGNGTPLLSTLISNVETNTLLVDKVRVFLIDGIETSVPAVSLRTFVESLFRFLAAIQFNRILSQAITIRLFLRLDLARGSIQNIEQQVEGHLLQLHWKKTAILNFALARIVSLPWFNSSFPLVCKEIQSNNHAISLGNLDDEISESLLLKIFPPGLERNKLKTTTFFSTYFSDAGGDSERNATFYPRLFDGFLKMLARKCAQEPNLYFPEGRLPSRIVLEAYDEASRDFISDVQVELYSFLDIDKDDSKNKDSVNSLINAFSGLRTPFVTEEIIPDLAKRSSISEEKVRQALRSMQDVGIFEERPGYPGELRTGRLYKAGLAMKYGRKREAN